MNLSNNAGTDDYPAWSPDGSRIAFHSSRDGNLNVFTMNADGTGVTRLTSDPAFDAGAAWSPDESKIAFRSDRHENAEIYVMNADGSQQTRITSNPAFDNLPDWAPANQPPDAVNDTATTVQGNPVTIAVLANDTDADGNALQVIAVTQPGDGTVVINPDNTITYSPDAPFSGPDAFTYTISDGRGGQDTATVNLTVLSPQQAIANVIAEIDALEEGGVLSDGQATSLIAKLDAAIGKLGKDDAEGAILKLELFLDRAGILPQPDQQRLIDEVLAVIQSLRPPA